MNKLILACALIVSLSACEEASKKIEDAQQALEDVQKTLESFNVEELNFEQLGAASQRAGELAQTIQEAIEGNLSDPAVLENAQEQIANAYSCLVDASSESTAEKVINTVLEHVNSEHASTMIERAIDMGKEAKNCVM